MMLVKSYLDKIGRTVALFKNNLPRPDWLEACLKRHSDMLRMRLCQNISSPKKKRKHQLPEEKDVDWMWRLAKVFKEVMKTRTWTLTHLFRKGKLEDQSEVDVGQVESEEEQVEQDLRLDVPVVKNRQHRQSARNAAELLLAEISDASSKEDISVSGSDPEWDP